MTKTLQTALAPLLIIGSFCNLGVFEYPLGQPRPYLSCLYTLIIWSYFTCFFYYPFYNIRWKAVIYNFRDIIMTTTAITSIFLSHYHFKEFRMCLHELSLEDNTLEALGTPKEYQQLRNWIIQIIIGWVVFIFSKLLAAAYIWKFFSTEPMNYYDILEIFLKNYPIFINILNALIWGSILGYISSKFHQVNDHLQVLYSDLFENNADRRQNRCILVRQRRTGVKDCKQNIWIIMHIHLQLCLISRKLNKIFNIQMLLQILYNFSETIAYYIEIYFFLILGNTIIWEPFFIFYFLHYTFLFILFSALFLTLNCICQIIYCKINETVTILHKLSNYNFDEVLDEQIFQFILQIKLRDVKFGTGLFYCGYSLIYQNYSTALFVLMIFISMSFTEYE